MKLTTMMKTFSLLLFTVSAASVARDCGSIMKDGKKISIPCQEAVTKSSIASIGRCSAKITFNGKTQTLKHNCPAKAQEGTTLKGKPVRLAKPKGDFLARQKRYRKMINRLAKKHRLDPALVHAVVSVESAYRSDAVSHKGAAGLMQLMPTTASDLNVKNITDPRANLDGGMRYLRIQLDRFKSIELALAAYNAGPENLVRYNNKIPPFAETQHYVRRVMAYRKRYQNDWKEHIK